MPCSCTAISAQLFHVHEARCLAPWRPSEASVRRPRSRCRPPASHVCSPGAWRSRCVRERVRRRRRRRTKVEKRNDGSGRERRRADVPADVRGAAGERQASRARWRRLLGHPDGGPERTGGGTHRHTCRPAGGMGWPHGHVHLLLVPRGLGKEWYVMQLVGGATGRGQRETSCCPGHHTPVEPETKRVTIPPNKTPTKGMEECTRPTVRRMEMIVMRGSSDGRLAVVQRGSRRNVRQTES